MNNKSTDQNNSLTPYLDAKRVYNERYGSHIQQAKIWQVVGICSLLLSGIAVFTALSLAKQPAYVPYIVEIDKLGRVSNVSLDYNKGLITPSITKAHIVNWLQDSRTIYSDGTAQRNAVNRCFGSLSSSDQSFKFMKEHTRSRVKRAKSETVAIEILAPPLMIAKNSWQVEWRETVRGLRGGKIREEIWKANLVLSIEGQPTKASIYTNPLGIYIRSIDWAKQSQESLR